MIKTLFAGLVASAVLAAAFTIPAAASCVDRGTCAASKKTTMTKTKVPEKKVHKSRTKKASTRKSRKHASTHKPSKSHHPASGQGGQVVALINAMAPAQGVPAWFALRIAKVESNYNPSLRGRAGEYGVFQLKCATAKGIGFRGNCSALLNPRINVQYGLKHLALAMKSSGGNLRLAASKHNGGLGRKTEIQGYVAKIF